MNNQEKWSQLHGDSKHHPIYPHEMYVKCVFKNFKKGSKILDLGCGAGRHVKFLAENNYITYGCDYSNNGVAYTKKLLNHYGLTAQVELASVNKLPYENEIFDGILCWGVLYYNDQQIIEKAAQEIYRVLKKEGKAFILTRNLNDYRYKYGIKSENKYRIIIQENNPKRSAYAENGMNMYFFDEEEVKRVFSMFKNIEINTLEVYHENNTICDSDYVVVLEK
ncbi:class I SAM-dependent methyltransferase [Campylobacter sp. CNRCH_2014_0184h]|uniref:class I SAM-dependent methyltransferase n=1 Tax=Campylobacter sp. CNRCH_2014_0184h TaxID=2911602 RepID=UPI0021E6D4B6|nr:class I SAM-dependent methyltransferase [Campylobacter sp. CNRCH_2014_0184h]MCV3482450.1 class I SAM-dependent methyltransferase [Campylobacter sp. CNRCH_2014_0184h]